MASLSSSINIHSVDCTNEALSNSIHKKCSFENENLDKNCILISEEINQKQKNQEIS